MQTVIGIVLVILLFIGFWRFEVFLYQGLHPRVQKPLPPKAKKLSAFVDDEKDAENDALSAFVDDEIEEEKERYAIDE